MASRHRFNDYNISKQEFNNKAQNKNFELKVFKHKEERLANNLT